MHGEISASLKIILRLFSEEHFKGIPTSSQIMELNENGKVDCQVSEWSKWSRCESCRGYTMSTRQIMVLSETYSRTSSNSSDAYYAKQNGLSMSNKY